MKKLAFILAISVCCILFTITKYNSNNNYTMQDAENILLDYMTSEGISHSVGSEEYLNYLLDQLMYKKDTKLANHNKYDLIIAYAGEYAYEMDQSKISESTFSRDKLSNMYSKTIKDIRKEASK